MQESENLLPTVIREGSAKLNTVGVKLVLEANGTDIDEEQFYCYVTFKVNHYFYWMKMRSGTN